jgi:energy-converting hydrogenase Eha subunit G
MNQKQRELIDEVGLGTLLAIAWCIGVLALLFLKPTPTMFIMATVGAAIGLLFAVGVVMRWIYLGRGEPVRAKHKGNRIRSRK